jgi:phosphoribosyl 1,2-cyclic phosphate phosphodiesterase
MTYDQALALAARLDPKAFRCVHLAHLVPWDLPYLGRDGETFVLGDHEPRMGPAAPSRPRL